MIFWILYFMYLHALHVYPLLGKDSVNIFSRNPTRATIGRLSLCNGAVNTPRKQFWLFSVESVPKGYKMTQNTRPSKGVVEYRVQTKWRVEFREASLLKVEHVTRGIEMSRIFWTGSFRIMTREELVCEKETSCVILSVRLLKLRCQGTTSEGWESECVCNGER
jgi:hypothetical protein